MSPPMSAIGPKQTCLTAPHMSAFEGKADIAFAVQMSAYDPKRTLRQFAPFHRAFETVRSPSGGGNETTRVPYTFCWHGSMAARRVGATGGENQAHWFPASWPAASSFYWRLSGRTARTGTHRRPTFRHRIRHRTKFGASFQSCN